MWLGSDQRIKTLQSHLPWVMIVVGVVCLALIARLFYLQVMRHGFYDLLARENKIVYERIPGNRGMILDRLGRTLVDNRPSWDVYILPDSFIASKRQTEKRERADRTLNRLAELLDLDYAELRKNVLSSTGRLRFRPVEVKRDLTWAELSRVEEASLRASGVFVRTTPIREYPYGELAAHTLGYIHEVSRSQLDFLKSEFPGLEYRQGDLVGKYGVEYEAERYLRGRDGYREQIVDAFGSEVDRRVVSELGFSPENREPEPGDNVVLTLDLELQQHAEEVLGGESGAIVAMDPYTGEILALVSRPAFDPNPFARRISSEEYRNLLGAPGDPLFSKALQGQYPPGSTWKPFIAVAGLEEDVVDKKFAPMCVGRMWFGRRWFHCWRRGGHGEVSLLESLKHSCDIYYYKLGIELGVDRMAQYVRLFGFDRATGIDLPGEKTGLIPDSAWKQRVRGEQWWPGENLPTAIGQGFNLVTPLQMARATAAIATGGTLVRPYVMKKVIDTSGQVVRDLSPGPETRVQLPVQPEHMKRVRDGLRAVVEDTGGTGWRARVKGWEVAGKTGTSQVVRLEQTEKYEDGEIPREFRDHAWFTAFAPFEAPRIVVTVLFEHGESGGGAAAPMAQKVIAKYKHLLEERATATLAPSPDAIRYTAAAGEERP